MAIYDIKLPNGQGWTTDVLSAISAYLDRHVENWNDFDSVVTIPILPRCDWEGPTDYASGSPESLDVFQTEEAAQKASKSHFVKKFETEMKILNSFRETFEEHSTEISTPAFLFHNLPLSGPHIQIISQLLGVPLTTENPIKSSDKKCSKSGQSKDVSSQKKVTANQNIQSQTNWSGELTDVAVISLQYPILLIESKPSTNELKKGHGQIMDSTNWFKTLLEKAFPCSSIKVVPVIGLPNTSNSETQGFKRRDYDGKYLYKENFTDRSTLKKWLDENVEKLKEPISKEDYSKLVSVLVLLKVAKLSKGSRKAQMAHNLMDSFLIQREVINTITGQSFLKGTFDIQTKADPTSNKQKKKAQKSKSSTEAVGVAPKSDTQSDSVQEIDSSSLQDFEQVEIGHALKTEFPGEREIVARAKVHEVSNQDDALFNQALFLNPEQSWIWDSPYPFQILGGYASTGKTVLLQNMIISKLREGDKVALFIPNCLIGLYEQFLETNFQDINSLKADGTLIIGDLKSIFGNGKCDEVYKQLLEEYNIFIDELNLLTESCPASILKLANEVWTNFFLKSKNKFWMAYDAFQGVHVKQADALKPDFSFDNLFDQLLSSKSGSSSKLTMAMRCTVQVLDEWKDTIPQSFLQSGHNVHGPLPIHFNINRKINDRDVSHIEDLHGSLFNDLNKTICQLLDKGWRQRDIAIIVASSWPAGAEKSICLWHLFFEKNIDSGLTNRYTVVRVGDRFKDENSIVIDNANSTCSQEWPILFIIEDLRCLYVSKFVKYVAKSRALSTIFVYRVNWADPEKQVDSNRELQQFDYQFILKHGKNGDIMALLSDYMGGTDKVLCELQDSAEIMRRKFMFRFTKAFHSSNINQSMGKFGEWLKETNQVKSFNSAQVKMRETCGIILSEAVKGMADCLKVCQSVVQMLVLESDVRITPHLLLYLCLSHKNLIYKWIAAEKAIRTCVMQYIPKEEVRDIH